MTKKSEPARAKRLDTQMPMVTATSSGGKKEALGTNRKSELMALRQEIKESLKSEQGSASAKTRAALIQIHAKYGDPEFKKAVREFNLTYKGVQDVNLVRNVSPSMGPVQ